MKRGAGEKRALVRARIGFEWLGAIYIFFRQYLARFGARVADAE